MACFVQWGMSSPAAAGTWHHQQLTPMHAPAARLCVQIVCASICGWGYAFMVTVLPVQKGYELLYDYGHSYCESTACVVSDTTAQCASGGGF